MAITKIHAIKSTLSDALAYIENPEKTEGQLLISGYNVDPLMASVEYELTAARARALNGNRSRTGGSNNLAYHLIQSFSPTDNVTAAQAHEIGKQLADQFLKGEFEYVVATHIDKGHIHNHIIINAVSFLSHKKLRTAPYKTAAQIRAISDKICIENDLSVIKDPKNLGCKRSEWELRRQQRSWKNEIRQRLNFALEAATSYEEFLAAAGKLGVVVDDSGKHIKYKIAGGDQQRFTRGDHLNPELISKAAITGSCANRHAAVSFLQGAIEREITGKSYTDFLSGLRKEGIEIRRTGSGVTYIVDDIELPERILGTAYATPEIQKMIQAGRTDFKGNAPVDLIAAYKATAENRQRGNVVPVVLQRTQLEKITENGICFRLDHDLVFVGSADVDVGDQECVAWIRSRGEYQHGSGQIHGEQLIRELEIHNGVIPETVTVSASAIRMNDKNIWITLPGQGITRLMLDPAQVNLSGEGAAIQIYKNWTYRYSTPQRGSRSITGAELLDILKAQPVINDGSLQWKLQSAQQKAKISEVKRLANTLQTLRNEGIERDTDFEQRVADLRQKQEETGKAIYDAKEKIAQYRGVAKLLQAVQMYKPIVQEYARLSGKAKERYGALHEGERTMYVHALKKLDEFGIDSTVDLQKIEDLIAYADGELRRLGSAEASIATRIESLRAAQTTVCEIQAGEPPER